MSKPRVLVHIVTWNSEESIRQCIERAIAQEGFSLGDDLVIRVTDNASTDKTTSIVREALRPGITLVCNQHNMGFCGAHNQGAAELLSRDFDAMLILNPDVGLEPTTLAAMMAKLDAGARIGLVTPKLVRALPDLTAIYPAVLDAAGMILARSVRHFDRGAGDWDWGQFNTGEVVFGGTGACLLVSKECVASVSLPETISDERVFTIYPQLRAGWSERPKLFDEAFFAYREDADLSWRAGLLGWRCWYEPTARANHVRAVTPERRATVSPSLNSFSVRNRFLMQWNNWRWSQGVLSFLYGVIFRNLVVVGGVVALEHSSFRGLCEAVTLMPRALAIRRWITERQRAGR